MEKRQYLIVTDNSSLGRNIQAHFDNDQLVELHRAETIPQAFSYMIKKMYCLIMMDLQLANIDLQEVIQMVRATKPFPILALTEELSDAEKIKLFYIGVDAFLEKPLNAEICSAQANALVELFLKNSTESSIEPGRYDPVSFGTTLIISPRFHRVSVAGQEVKLTRREFDLLIFFARHPNQVFTLGQLYQNVWGDYSELGGDATVRTHIKKLRQKLSVLDMNLIINEWGTGYKFVPPTKEQRR